MSPLRPIPPEDLKKLLENHGGYTMVHEDEHNWYMARGLKGVPLPIPKEPGDDGCVAVEIMEWACSEANIDAFTLFAFYTSGLGDSQQHN